MCLLYLVRQLRDACETLYHEEITINAQNLEAMPGITCWPMRIRVAIFNVARGMTNAQRLETVARYRNVSIILVIAVILIAGFNIAPANSSIFTAIFTGVVVLVAAEMALIGVIVAVDAVATLVNMFCPCPWWSRGPLYAQKLTDEEGDEEQQELSIVADDQGLGPMSPMG